MVTEKLCFFTFAKTQTRRFRAELSNMTTEKAELKDQAMDQKKTSSILSRRCFPNSD